MTSGRRLDIPGALALLLAMVTLLGACSGSASAPTAKPVAAPTTPPAPTAAPAKPAEAAKPVEAAKPSEAAKPAAAAKPAEPAKPAAGPAQVVNFAVANNIGYVPWYLGVEQGVFVKNGADVKIRLLNSGPEVSKALQAGEIQLGISAFGTLIPALAEGIKIKGIYLTVNDATQLNPDRMFAIIAQPGSSVTKIEDLKSKKVGTTLGSTPDNYLKAVLTKNGVPIDSVEYVNATVSNMPAAFDSGLEVVSAYEPYAEQILAKHPGAKVLSRGGGHVAQRIVITAREDWLAANRPLVEKVLTGLVEAQYLARTKPELAGDVVPRWLSGIDGKTAAKAVQSFDYDPRFSRFVRQSWDSENQLLIDQKKLKSPVPFEQAIDHSIAEDVLKNNPRFLTDLKPVPS